MMYSAFDDAVQALRRDGFRLTPSRNETMRCVMTTCGGTNIPLIHVMIWNDIGQDTLGIRLAMMRNIPYEKCGQVVMALNWLNNNYPWAKFALLTEPPCEAPCEVHITYDFPPTDRNVGQEISDTIEYLVRAADESYPRLMRAVQA